MGENTMLTIRYLDIQRRQGSEPVSGIAAVD
jgi:hypothetical protein